LALKALFGSFVNQNTTINHYFKNSMTLNYVAEDMVACSGAGGLSITFVVKGTPTVQKKACDGLERSEDPVPF
jgi:hypothetical protein